MRPNATHPVLGQTRISTSKPRRGTCVQFFQTFFLNKETASSERHTSTSAQNLTNFISVATDSFFF